MTRGVCLVVVSIVCQFIIALGQIVVAMAISTWYFTRDKSTINSSTVFSSIRLASFYHTGTAAFGQSGARPTHHHLEP